MSTTTAAQIEDEAPGRTATIIGGAFGNFIEWYDWTIFGLLSAVFAGQIILEGGPQQRADRRAAHLRGRFPDAPGRLDRALADGGPLPGGGGCWRSPSS